MIANGIWKASIHVSVLWNNASQAPTSSPFIGNVDAAMELVRADALVLEPPATAVRW